MSARLSLLAATLLLAACGGGADAAPTPTGPSGSLGIVTAESAAGAVAAVCGLRATSDRDTANALFYDEAHTTLHALAAAAEEVDRVPSAQVLQTMQRVEADLGDDALPDAFPGDARALLDAMRAALLTLDLPAPGCRPA